MDKGMLSTGTALTALGVTLAAVTPFGSVDLRCDGGWSGDDPYASLELLAIFEETCAYEPRRARTCIANLYFALGWFENALLEFDAAIWSAAEDEVLPLTIIFCKARTLYELGRYSEAKELLDAHCALWEHVADLKEEADGLYKSILNALESRHEVVGGGPSNKP